MEEVKLLIDTGAVLPWIPAKVLERIRIKPIGKKVFRIIEGGRVERLVSLLC